MICKFCGKEISDEEKFCPYCGKQQADPPKVVLTKETSSDKKMDRNSFIMLANAAVTVIVLIMVAVLTLKVNKLQSDVSEISSYIAADEKAQKRKTEEAANPKPAADEPAPTEDEPELVEITPLEMVRLPEVPFEVSYLVNGNVLCTYRITNIYGDGDDNTSFDEVYVDGICIYDKGGDDKRRLGRLKWIMYQDENTVADSGDFYISNIRVDENFSRVKVTEISRIAVEKMPNPALVIEDYQF